jgi:hypothetical protein
MLNKIRKFLVSWLTTEKPAHDIPLCDFERIRYELRPGDVLLVEGRTRVSEVIKQITLSPWSHATLYIGRPHDIKDTQLREKILALYPVDPNIQLVVESHIGQGTVLAPLDIYKNDHVRLCRPKGLSHQDAQLVIAYIVNKLGLAYDVRQVVDLARFIIPWSVFPRRWRSSLFQHNIGEPTRTICSTMIAEAFGSIDFPILPVIKKHEANGIELFARNPRLFTPRDFDYSPYFEIIKFPFISYVESPYRHLPWNRTGLVSQDGTNIVDPSLQVAKLKSKPRFKFRKKSQETLLNAAATETIIENTASTQYKKSLRQRLLSRLVKRF